MGEKEDGALLSACDEGNLYAARQALCEVSICVYE